MPIVGLRIVSWTPIVNTKEKIMPKTTKRNVDDRKGIIGGSSLGAMLGLSKYQSKHDVWLSWKGEERKITEKQQEIFDMGHALEDFIAKQAEKKYGVKVKKTSLTYIHPQLDWLICHPDRLVVGKVDGKRVGIEIKSSSSYDDRWGQEDSSEVPMDYLCQCHDYIMCDVCDVVWLIRFSNNRLTRYIITKDEELESMILAQAIEEMEKWKNGEEPIIEDYEEAKSYYNDSTEGDIEATEEILKAAEEIKSLKEQTKAMEDRIDELKTQIIGFMKDKKRLVDHFNNKLFSYTRIESTNFDTKAFKKDYPKLYEEYTSKSSYMKFQ